MASGPNKLNVIVPVGLEPARVAVSEMASPTVASGDASAENANEELPKPTAWSGSRQAVGPAGAWRASPL